jgi:gliding motility-associated-like protein
MKKILLTVSALWMAAAGLRAQVINAGPDTFVCPPGSTTLNATTTAQGSTNYTIGSIPYLPNPYNTGTFVSMSDDSQTGPFPIGFNFEFFGVCYTDFYIGSNGWVAFSPQPVTYTSASIPSTSGTVPKNCIMGPWQDWHPGIAGGPYINYQVLGSAPFRRLVVSWNNCPMYSCTTTLGTFQIVIYETTNIIENFLANKPNCLSWAGGTAVQGVHDATGTVAFTVPGRNSTQWTAVNEGWRFNPGGAPVIVWYQSGNPTPIGTGSSVTVSPTTTTSYVAQVAGCSSGSDTVVVNVGPSVSASPTVMGICAGGSVNLTASGVTTYSWSPATGLSCTTCPNPTATPSTTTTYTVTGTNQYGCTSTATVFINVQPLPNASVSPSAPTICNGGSVVLTASGGTSYNWSPSTGLSATNVSNPTANPTATTTYTVQVTNAGCTSSTSVTVTVAPPPTVSAGPDATICNGSSTTLSGSGTGPTFSWSPGTGLSSTSVTNPTANPTATTTYTLVTTDANGCSNSDVVVVNVSTPSVTVSTPPSICPGGNVSLFANSNGIAYTWTPSTGLSCTNCPGPTASPTVTTTYTVIIADPNGCTASASVTVTVNNITVTCNAPAAICSGNSTQLNATSSATNYSWSPATGLSSTTIANPIASPTTTTTYTVVATDPNGCSATTTVTVTVNPVPAASAGLDASYCAGGTTQLNATGGGTYSWSPATGLSNTTIANPMASPTVTTTYVVTVSNGQCAASDSMTVTVYALPNINAGQNTAICFGASTQLSATGGLAYSWTPASGLSSTTVSNPTSFPTATTTYTVVGVDQNGCSNTSSVTVTINPLPVANAGPDVIICGSQSTQLNATGGGTYSWTPATGLSCTTCANPTANPGSTTTYTVIVTNTFGCTASDNMTVTIGPGFTLANAAATDATCGNSDGTATAGTPNGGTSPYTYSWNNGQTTVTATGLATGTYTVIVTDANGCTGTQTVVVNSVLGVNANASATPSAGIAPLNVAFTNTTTGATNYIWNFGDGSPLDNTFAPSHTYTAPGVYTVILVTYNNSPACADTITLTIIVEETAVLTVPNVFTPNGDGQNDVFSITSKGIKSAHAVIFNRWGSIIAEWDPLTSSWDGKGAVDGVYYYVITATDYNDKGMEEKGFVQVLSNR